jgi:hypothetical protein
MSEPLRVGTAITAASDQSINPMLAWSKAWVSATADALVFQAVKLMKRKHAAFKLALLRSPEPR